MTTAIKGPIQLEGGEFEFVWEPISGARNSGRQEERDIWIVALVFPPVKWLNRYIPI